MAGAGDFLERGVDKDELLADLVANRHDDADWRAGRLFSLIYHPDDPGLEDTLAAVSTEYLAENALNPFRFPSLARLERETADMVADLLHGTPGAGGLTSGGTESILVAVYVAREIARERGNSARSSSPASRRIQRSRRPVTFSASSRCGCQSVPTTGSTWTCSPTPSTTAPRWWWPPPPTTRTASSTRSSRSRPWRLSAAFFATSTLASAGCCCRSGNVSASPCPRGTSGCRGVTSISADIHKYGYSYKGASVLLHRDRANYAKQWWFDDGAWGGGLYGSPTPAGTRPAPPIAGAWAALRFLGADGYLEMARIVRDTRDLLLRGIEQIDGLRVTHDPTCQSSRSAAMSWTSPLLVTH